MAQTIRAAIVETPSQAPVVKTTSLADPTPSQTRIKVLAAGLHQLVRSRASGKHYSSHASGPIIPGTVLLSVLRLFLPQISGNID